MTLDDFKNILFKERQAVDALATTVKSNAASIMAIIASIAIPFVPAIFAANGVYVQTSNWSENWRIWAAIAVAIAIEGAGMFLSILVTKTYSAWRKKAATVKEVWAIGLSVILYTIIVIVLISFSDIPMGLKFTVALIPLLGVAFYIGMGFETDLANRLDEQADEKRQRKAERLSQKNVSTHDTKTVSKSPIIERDETILTHLNDTPLTHLAKQIGVSRSTLYRRLDELEQTGKIHKNGEGWKVK
jgi:DNA-binding transcriptional ArsR family regulator